MNDKYEFNVKKKRPEEIYRNASEYFKGQVLSQYAKSKSIMHIQEKITIRALELLDLKDKSALFLDAGCGPGFASIYLKELGYEVVALDLITEFLSYYDIKELNPIRSDMCLPPFRSNTFNAIISISALQWIYSEITDKVMESNLINMVKSFHIILKPNAKAIFQFYPKNNIIMENIGKIIADNTEFTGNFIIDNLDNPKKRKIFLLLQK
ncbi:MAG: class I SAM-dependent methyltransferase [Promethearchaeota archaeon]